LLKDADVDEKVNGPTLMSDTRPPTVHKHPGEILELLPKANQDAEENCTNAGTSDSRNGSAKEPIDPATMLARDLEAMGPTFIKIGQFLSTRADVLPAKYL